MIYIKVASDWLLVTRQIKPRGLRAAVLVAPRPGPSATKGLPYCAHSNARWFGYLAPRCAQSAFRCSGAPSVLDGSRRQTGSSVAMATRVTPTSSHASCPGNASQSASARIEMHQQRRAPDVKITNVRKGRMNAPIPVGWRPHPHPAAPGMCGRLSHSVQMPAVGQAGHKAEARAYRSARLAHQHRAIDKTHLQESAHAAALLLDGRDVLAHIFAPPPVIRYHLCSREGEGEGASEGEPQVGGGACAMGIVYMQTYG
jgi:hypothetical protein